MNESPFFHLAGIQKPGTVAIRLEILKELFENPSYHYTFEDLVNKVNISRRVASHVLEDLVKEEYVIKKYSSVSNYGYMLNKENKTIEEIHKAENRINGIKETTLEEFFGE